VPILLEKFKDTTWRDRCHVPSVLGGIGAADPAVLPALTQALREKDHNTRRFAAIGLGRMGHDAAPAVPALMEMVKDEAEHAFVRQSGIEALEKIGPAGRAAKSVLMEVGRSHKGSAEYWELRSQAIVTLARLDPQDKDLLPFLAGLLEDPQVLVAMKAAEALGELGAGARPAVPALAAALKRTEPRETTTLRLLTVQALAKVGPDPAVVEALRSALNDSDAMVSRVAKEALEQLRKGRAEEKPEGRR
jgi:HEAT repeat protein